MTSTSGSNTDDSSAAALHYTEYQHPLHLNTKHFTCYFTGEKYRTCFEWIHIVGKVSYSLL